MGVTVAAWSNPGFRPVGAIRDRGFSLNFAHIACMVKLLVVR